MTCNDLCISEEDLGCINDLMDLMTCNQKDRSEGPFTNCRQKSTLMPPIEEPSCIEVFTQLVTEDLKELESQSRYSNLNKSELRATKTLQSDESLVIKA